MPQTYRVIISPRAFADLGEILDYIEKDSPARAAKMLDRLWDSAHSLKVFPHRYPAVAATPRLLPETRSMPVSPYIIYFRFVEKQSVVRIVSIRHGARSQPRHL